MEPSELYLIRHAIAADPGPEWPDDRQRPLTEEGRRRFEEVVRGLRAIDVTLDEIFTSPLVRAVQTASILSDGFGGLTVRPLDALAPQHAPTHVLAAVASAATGRRLALVGHEPDLGELAAYLLDTPRALAFRKGGVCRIDLPSLERWQHGALQWFAPPKILRRIS